MAENRKLKRLTTFDGNHGRMGEIWVSTEVCDVCFCVDDVIAIDASEDEYKPGYICLRCIKEALGDE